LRHKTRRPCRPRGPPCTLRQVTERIALQKTPYLDFTRSYTRRDYILVNLATPARVVPDHSLVSIMSAGWPTLAKAPCPGGTG
jgi:hypothetical protein